MSEDLERLKHRIPLLEYLNRHQWKGQRVGTGPEFVGLCPLHEETHASFYVNTEKNLFFCHGCGRGGDLIRFVELSRHLSFRESVAHLAEAELSPTSQLLAHTATFYQTELHRYGEGMDYLVQRGIHSAKLIEELGIGYARGGTLCPHLQDLGYSLQQMRQIGLINSQGEEVLSERVIFPCRHQSRIVNLYGRRIRNAFPHRFLPGSKGGMFAWESIRQFRSMILVEGLFDLAVLWQAGFRCTTCAMGSYLTATQLVQLRDNPDRCVYIAFDQDENRAGQLAAEALRQVFAKRGLKAHLVGLPAGHDPNSYFVAGATAQDFACLIEEASLL